MGNIPEWDLRSFFFEVPPSPGGGGQGLRVLFMLLQEGSD
jgi:hypothetical protein